MQLLIFSLYARVKPNGRFAAAWFPSSLHIKAEEDYVAVFYDVVFAFNAHQSFFPGGGQRALLQQILIVYYLGLDKPSLEVGMDLSCRLRRLRTDPDGPCPGLILSYRKSVV